MAKRRTKREKTPFSGQLAALFSFPECLLSGVPYLELQGDSSLAVTGYESLLLYEEGDILFRMRDPVSPHFTHLRIKGTDLTLSVVRDGCLSVRGRIDAVILHPRDIGLS